MEFYFTADKETYTWIDRVNTYEEAASLIKQYEEEDRQNGDYTDDFYVICKGTNGHDLEIVKAIDVTEIGNIINEAEYMKKSYFWSPPERASARRSYERTHSHNRVEWEEGGHKYSAMYVVDCSCKNVYAKGYYTKDGNKTTLTAIKNSYKRLLDKVN